MKVWQNLYLTNRFFLIMMVVIVLFIVSWASPTLFLAAKILLCCCLLLSIVDAFVLFSKDVNIDCKRNLPDILSLGNTQRVNIEIKNLSKIFLSIGMMDELPMQFQERKLNFSFQLSPKEKKDFVYELRPVTRGEYLFGGTNVFLKSKIGIVERRIKFGKEVAVAVYPSIVEMKQLELLALSNLSIVNGVKKIRRIGHSYEFDQIKNYVVGDDLRSINWKATSRKAEIMVNHYEDEKSQQVYSIIDKSRSMRMPFNEMSLLDYAVNTSLVISNVALQKQDKAGLITFADKLGTLIKASRGSKQLRQILKTLYAEKEKSNEANFELLYQGVRHLIKSRSLIFLFTNFESSYALERVLSILRKINKLHLLVVVFFENTEISDYAMEPAKNIEEIYTKTVAHVQVYEKHQIATILKQYGIQSIVARPEEISIKTLNKYLELKARGMI
jgi:uncharacterized protein (DUF58 family)